MTIKEKYYSINQSNLSNEQITFLKKIKDLTNDFETTDTTVLNKAESALDKIIKVINLKQPEALKQEKEVVEIKQPEVSKQTKKVVKTKKPVNKRKSSSTTIQKKPTIFSKAKEIRKEGESWESAKARATKMIKGEKEEVVKVMNSELKSLLQVVRRRKELKAKYGKKSYELGGAFMNTDLAGHSGGGTGGLNTGMPLSGTSGTYYTGLVGETGAMSSGEMFKKGGELPKLSELREEKNGTTVSFYQDYGNIKFHTQVFKTGDLYQVYQGATNLPFQDFGNKTFEKRNEAINFAKDSIKRQIDEYKLHYTTPKEIKDYVGKHFAYANNIYYIGGLRKNAVKQSIRSERTGKIVDISGQYKPSFIVLEIETNNKLPVYDENQRVIKGSVLHIIDLDDFKKKKYFKISSKKLPSKIQEHIDSYKTYFKRFENQKYESGGDMKQNQEVINDASQTYVITESFGNPAQQLGMLAKGGGILSKYVILFENNKGNKESMRTEAFNKAEAMKIGKFFETYPTQFKRGGFKVVDVKEVENEDEYKDGGYMAKGGKIIDQYEGRTPEDIWNNLSISQKYHFIEDHIEEIKESRNVRKLYPIFIEKGEWSSLDNDVKQIFTSHVKLGQYATGGSIPNNYEGRTPEDVWNNLNTKQRLHFLFDHFLSNSEKFLNREEYLKAERQIAETTKDNWSSLPRLAQIEFESHVKKGQYASGGSLGKALYVEYSSYFDYNNYDEKKIMSALESVGAKNIRLENDRGWFNQPEVVVFNGDKNKAQDALNEAFDTDYIRVSEKDWRTKKMANGGSFAPNVADGTQFMNGVYANGGSVGDDFEEVIDLGAEQYYTRPFGMVESESNGEVELVAVATIKDLEDYISEDELPEEGNFQLDITLVPTEEFISEEILESANDEDSSSISDDSVINVVNYAGGLNYTPQEKVFFETHQDALDYLMSDELKEQINRDSYSSDYIMYKQYNRAGQTNSDYLDYLMGVTDRFAKGGGVSGARYKFDIGDKVMIDDRGYVTAFTEFDLSKPAEIIDRSTTKMGGKTYYFYKVKMADGRVAFNRAEQSKLTLVEKGSFANGGSFAPNVSNGTQFMSDVYARGGSVGDTIYKDDNLTIQKYHYETMPNFVSFKITYLDNGKNKSWYVDSNLGGDWPKKYYDTEIEEKIIKILKNHLGDNYANGGSFAPNVSNGTQFMSDVYAFGGSMNGSDKKPPILVKLYNELDKAKNKEYLEWGYYGNYYEFPHFIHFKNGLKSKLPEHEGDLEEYSFFLNDDGKTILGINELTGYDIGLKTPKDAIEWCRANESVNEDMLKLKQMRNKFSNGGSFAPNVSNGTQFMSDVYADGGDLTTLQKGDRVLLKDGTMTRVATVSQDGLDSQKRVKVRPDGFPFDISVTLEENSKTYVIKKLMSGGSYAHGGGVDGGMTNLTIQDVSFENGGSFAPNVSNGTQFMSDVYARGGFFVDGGRMDYWEDYHEDSKKIQNPTDMQIEQEVEACVEFWNDNNEMGEENEVNDEGEKIVIKLAKEFVKAKGYISSDIIDAMIAQETYAEGGSLPYLTDNNFGNFQDSILEKGGAVGKVYLMTGIYGAKGIPGKVLFAFKKEIEKQNFKGDVNSILSDINNLWSKWSITEGAEIIKSQVMKIVDENYIQYITATLNNFKWEPDTINGLNVGKSNELYIKLSSDFVINVGFNDDIDANKFAKKLSGMVNTAIVYKQTELFGYYQEVGYNNIEIRESMFILIESK